MTPIEEIEAAARKVRSLAEAVPSEHWGDRPWHVEECAEKDFDNCPCIVAQGRGSVRDFHPESMTQYVADAETPEHAYYMAIMHPGAGKAVARWLEALGEMAKAYPEMAHDHDRPACEDFACAVMGRGIELARIFLTEPTEGD